MSEPADRGGQTAREQLVLAAINEMQQKTPGQIRSRDIAARANVNYGLIHHYFGSKDALLRAALERLVSEFVDDMPPHHSLAEVASPVPSSTASDHGRLWTVLANIASDPAALDALRWDYPVLRRMVTEAESRHDGEPTLEMRASIAAAVTLTLGWMTYRHFVSHALEFSETELEAVGSKITAIIDDLWKADRRSPSSADS